MDGAEQPARTARIDGDMFTMRAAASESDTTALITQAREINAPVTDFMFAHSARVHYGYSPRAVIRPANKTALAKWPELAAYRGERYAPMILWERSAQ